MATKLSAAHEQYVRQEFARVPFAKLLGIEVETLEHGVAVLLLTIDENLKQNNGVVHGGAIASLVDTANAIAILTTAPRKDRVTTIDLTISYLRPLLVGRARAVARVLRAGRRVIAVSAEVMTDDGTLAATALSTYLRLDQQ